MTTSSCKYLCSWATRNSYCHTWFFSCFLVHTLHFTGDEVQSLALPLTDSVTLSKALSCLSSASSFVTEGHHTCWGATELHKAMQRDRTGEVQASCMMCGKSLHSLSLSVLLWSGG